VARFTVALQAFADTLAHCAVQCRLSGTMKAETPLFERDMDLVRAILFWAEDAGRPAKRPDADKLALCYHVKIMVEAELIDGLGDYHRVPGEDRFEPGLAVVKGITWKGQDFLAAMRSETAWKAVKNAFAKHGVPFVTSLLVEALKGQFQVGGPSAP